MDRHALNAVAIAGISQSSHTLASAGISVVGSSYTKLQFCLSHKKNTFLEALRIQENPKKTDLHQGKNCKKSSTSHLKVVEPEMHLHPQLFGSLPNGVFHLFLSCIVTLLFEAKGEKIFTYIPKKPVPNTQLVTWTTWFIQVALTSWLSGEATARECHPVYNQNEEGGKKSPTGMQIIWAMSWKT